MGVSDRWLALSWKCGSAQIHSDRGSPAPTTWTVNKTAFETWFGLDAPAAMAPILFAQLKFHHAQVSSKVKTTPK